MGPVGLLVFFFLLKTTLGKHYLAICILGIDHKNGMGRRQNSLPLLLSQPLLGPTLHFKNDGLCLGQVQSACLI